MNIEENNRHLVFKGLADPQRIKILEILQSGEECNCHLSEKMEMPLSTLAHHLRVLTSANLVLARKEGKWTYYTLNTRPFEDAIGMLSKFL